MNTYGACPACRACFALRSARAQSALRPLSVLCPAPCTRAAYRSARQSPGIVLANWCGGRAGMATTARTIATERFGEGYWAEPTSEMPSSLPSGLPSPWITPRKSGFANLDRRAIPGMVRRAPVIGLLGLLVVGAATWLIGSHVGFVLASILLVVGFGFLATARS